MIPAGVVGRVGGLAAALGAGVVVGLAVAAPASADDSGSGDSSPRAAATQHSAGRSAAGVGAAARRGPRAAAASTGGGSARPASVVSAGRVVRSASAVAIPARVSRTVPQSVVLTAPAAATPVVPQSAAATRGKLITVYRGLHFVLPGSPAFFVKQVSGTGTFTTNSAYDLTDVDQYDWNKFTGIVFSPLQHDRNSVMVGWRYNLTTQEFEIAPFYNVNKERILPNEQTEVISVPADGTFQYSVDYSGVTIRYGDKTVFKPYPPGLTPNVWTASRVSGWFGGNEAAPRTLTYYLNLK